MIDPKRSDDLKLPDDFHTGDDFIVDELSHLREEQRKSSKQNLVIMIITLVISALTFIVSAAGLWLSLIR